MKFCANLTYLFKELPFLDRFRAAAAAGFDGVEVLFPYDHPAPLILRQLTATGLPLALINAPPPNYAGGPRGFAAVPESTDRFRRDFARVLRYAERLRPQHIHLMAGVAEGAEAHKTLIDNLRWATAKASSESFVIEPIFPADLAGYFLSDFDLAVDIIKEVGAPNLRLQFDTYHAQMLTGDAVAAWKRYGHRVGHVQIGDTPKRGVPGSGAVDFEAFFKALHRSGYNGWVSGEYNSSGPTEESLSWMRFAA